MKIIIIAFSIFSIVSLNAMSLFFSRPFSFTNTRLLIKRHFEMKHIWPGDIHKKWNLQSQVFTPGSDVFIPEAHALLLRLSLQQQEINEELKIMFHMLRKRQSFESNFFYNCRQRTNSSHKPHGICAVHKWKKSKNKI